MDQVVNDGWLEGHAFGRRFEEARMTETLLGAAMRQDAVMSELVSCGFGEDDLDLNLHRLIWRTARELHTRGVPPEPAIVEAKLLSGGADVEAVHLFIGGCLRGGVEVAHPRLPAFVQHVRTRVALRRLGALGQQMAKDVGHDGASPSRVATSATAEIERILTGAATADGADGADIASIIESALHADGTTKGPTTAHSLCHPTLDDMLGGGGIEGTVVLMSAQIGIGKSTFARAFVRSLCKRGVPTLYFSFEMSREEIAMRLQRAESGVLLSKGSLTARERSRVIEARNEIATWPIFIEDRQQVTVEDVTTRVRHYKKRHGVRAVVVDYIQDIEASTRHSRDDLNHRHISKSLRRCADDERVLMIEMAQQKEIDERGSKDPDNVVADTRQYVKDASAHISLTRKKLDDNLRHLTKLSLTKNRYETGTLGDAWMVFDESTGVVHPCDQRGQPLRPQTAVQMEVPDDLDF